MYELLMIGVGLLLTVGTGMFVASEFALVNLDRGDLEARDARGEKGLKPTTHRSYGDTPRRRHSGASFTTNRPSEADHTVLRLTA